MKTFLTAALVAAAGFVAAPAIADDDTIFGYSKHYAQIEIENQGFDVVDLTEWGDYIVATVVGEDGRQSFRYFNQETRKLVR